ncbi:MAG: hypothetical protein JEZ06_07640 [Anaerolineaceae bacterium]|nr:hypothetical protein [Anaerolineaceae bacterium]
MEKYLALLPEQPYSFGGEFNTWGFQYFQELKTFFNYSYLINAVFGIIVAISIILIFLEGEVFQNRKLLHIDDISMQSGIFEYIPDFWKKENFISYSGNPLIS